MWMFRRGGESLSSCPYWLSTDLRGNTDNCADHTTLSWAEPCGHGEDAPSKVWNLCGSCQLHLTFMGNKKWLKPVWPSQIIRLGENFLMTILRTWYNLGFSKPLPCSRTGWRLGRARWRMEQSCCGGWEGPLWVHNVSSQPPLPYF